MTARKSRHDRPEVQYGRDNIGGVCSMLKLNISIEPLERCAFKAWSCST